jgi:hypothetical protein
MVVDCLQTSNYQINKHVVDENGMMRELITLYLRIEQYFVYRIRKYFIPNYVFVQTKRGLLFFVELLSAHIR